MTDTPNTLTPLQAARLRAADGLASGEDRRLLADDGEDEDQIRRDQLAWLETLQWALSVPPLDAEVWPRVRDALRLSEAPPSSSDLHEAVASQDPQGLTEPNVSAAVADALGHEAPSAAVGDALRAAAGAEPDVSAVVLRVLGEDVLPVGPALEDAAGPQPDLSDAVLSALDLPPGSALGVREALQAAAGTPPDVVPGVLQDIAEPTRELRTVLTAAAGPAPDVADAVLAKIGIAEAPVDTGRTEVGAAGPGTHTNTPALPRVEGTPTQSGAALPAAANTAPARFPVWSAVAVGALALAAAVLFFVSPGSQDVEPVSFELAAVNEVEIEDLTVGEEAMVQVLQFEEDAPTIIFVDVPEEPTAPGNEGATL